MMKVLRRQQISDFVRVQARSLLLGGCEERLVYRRLVAEMLHARCRAADGERCWRAMG